MNMKVIKSLLSKIPLQDTFQKLCAAGLAISLLWPLVSFILLKAYDIPPCNIYYLQAMALLAIGLLYFICIFAPRKRWLAFTMVVLHYPLSLLGLALAYLQHGVMTHASNPDSSFQAAVEAADLSCLIAQTTQFGLWLPKIAIGIFALVFVYNTVIIAFLLKEK